MSIFIPILKLKSSGSGNLLKEDFMTIYVIVVVEDVSHSISHALTVKSMKRNFNADEVYNYKRDCIIYISKHQALKFNV